MSSGGGGGGGGCRSRVSMSADVNERAIVVDVIVVVVVVETKMITNTKKSADRPRSTGFALFCVLVCYPHRYPHRYPTPLPPTPFWLRVVGSFFLFVVRAASIVFANRRRQPMPPPPLPSPTLTRSAVWFHCRLHFTEFRFCRCVLLPVSLFRFIVGLRVGACRRRR